MLRHLVWSYLRQHKTATLTLIFLQLLATLAGLELPTLNARIIDEGVAVADTGMIWKLGMLMVGLTAGQGVCTAIAVFLGARLAMGMGAYLRKRTFTHIQGFSSTELHAFGAPTLITRSTNDITQIQTVVMMLFSLIIQAPLMGVGALVQSWRQDSSMATILFVMMPVLVVTIAVLMRPLLPLFGVQQERLDAQNLVVREELTGLRVIRAFNRQGAIEQRYMDANDALRAVAMRIGGTFAIFFPIVMLIISATNLAVVWFGAHGIDAGHTQVGSLFAFISYVGMLFGSVMMSMMMFIMVPRASIAAGRIAEVLDRPWSITDPDASTASPSTTVHRSSDLGNASNNERWIFSLRDVTVQYPGAESPVLQGLNVTLKPGTMTAVIGPTGSGKSTLAKLFPRLLDPTAGAVTANGIALTDLPVHAVRERIGMVPQKAHLFHGTIATNVSSESDPSPQQRARVLQALEAAQASDFVSMLEDGIDSPVESGGKNFSGGQRQRLTIARALYRDADLFIFDDSSSALDNSTDARLRKALRTYSKDAAILQIAQRVSSVREADMILVLDDGRIVGQGTHEELLASCPTYIDIVRSQDSGGSGKTESVTSGVTGNMEDPAATDGFTTDGQEGGR